MGGQVRATGNETRWKKTKPTANIKPRRRDVNYLG